MYMELEGTIISLVKIISTLINNNNYYLYNKQGSKLLMSFIKNKERHDTKDSIALSI